MGSERVLSHFHKLLTIPHPSYHEEKIADYLAQFGQQRGLTVLRDPYHNVILKKTGSPGAPSVVLQAHSDMVWVSDQDVPEGAELPRGVHVEDGKMRTSGTSLGADDGIGVALMLAILEEDDPQLPSIEAVFTANEEETMEGAMMLQPSYLRGKYLINLDSEEEGVLTIGAAGGISCVCTLPIRKRPASFSHGILLQISGGKGGHSGLEIQEKRENAIKLLVRILRSLPQADWELVKLEGGSRSNAIPTQGSAWLNTSHPQEIQQAVAEFVARHCHEWNDEEPELTIQALVTAAGETAYESEDAERVFLLLENLPHGVSSQTSEFVCSSVNLALLWETENEISAELSLRSSFASWYHDEAKRIARLTHFLEGSTMEKDEYAAWQYQKDSHLLQVMQDAYRQLFGTEAACENVHAGVECGIIMEQCPSIQEAISIGPTILGAHTTQEELDVASVDKVYRLLVETLRKLNSFQEELCDE